MPIPNQVFAIQDPGLGLVTLATSVPLVFGHSSTGTVDEIKSFSSINDLVAEYGEGQLVETAAFILQTAGGPVVTVRSATSVAGANSVVTASGGGPTVSLAGTPNDNYVAKITIVLGGALGTATFTYSLDNDKTVSQVLTVPSGGSFVVPNTAITVTFASGTYVAAETYTWTSTAPMWDASDADGILAAIQASTIAFDFMVGAGKHATASAAATIFSALDVDLTTLFNEFRFLGVMMDAGNDTATNVLSSFASVSSQRVSAWHDDHNLLTAKSFVGWGQPSMPVLISVAARATGALISTDLGRTAAGSSNSSGRLPGVQSITHDEEKNELLDSSGIGTLRTIQGLSGVFITRGRIKAASGSDFTDWQLRRIMDAACRVIHRYQSTLLNSGVRTNSDGTIDERDAIRWETGGEAALRAVLTQPGNAEGFAGHVSDLRYTIDRTNNVLATSQVNTEVAIRPLGYARTISTTLGFSTNLGGQTSEQAAE